MKIGFSPGTPHDLGDVLDHMLVARNLKSRRSRGGVTSDLEPLVTLIESWWRQIETAQSVILGSG